MLGLSNVHPALGASISPPSPEGYLLSQGKVLRTQALKAHTGLELRECIQGCSWHTEHEVLLNRGNTKDLVPVCRVCSPGSWGAGKCRYNCGRPPEMCLAQERHYSTEETESDATNKIQICKEKNKNKLLFT